MTKISTLFLHLGNIERQEVVDLMELLDPESAENKKTKNLLDKLIVKAPESAVSAILEFAKNV